jgi:hypothetical protein
MDQDTVNEAFAGPVEFDRGFRVRKAAIGLRRDRDSYHAHGRKEVSGVEELSQRCGAQSAPLYPNKRELALIGGENGRAKEAEHPHHLGR